jgi:hypothetical protein
MDAQFRFHPSEVACLEIEFFAHLFKVGETSFQFGKLRITRTGLVKTICVGSDFA